MEALGSRNVGCLLGGELSDGTVATYGGRRGLGRVSRFQGLKPSMMRGLGAWEHWLEALTKCLWTTELRPAFCLVRCHGKT